MRIVKFIVLGTLVAFASCRSTQKIGTTTPQIPIREITASLVVDTIQQKPASLQGSDQQTNNYPTESAMLALNSNNHLQENKDGSVEQPQSKFETNNTDFTTMSASFENKQSNNIQSFAQVKQMAATKQINLTSKQLKRLDKLENKYHGDFNKFKEDAGNIFDTQTSKIIAAVGIIGLVLLLITSSGFGAFLFILSIGALLLKWLGIVSF